MSGTSRTGFTLLELVVVMMLVGIMATIIIPNLRYLMPMQTRKEFATQFTKLVQFGWQNALITQKVHRIFFDLKKNSIKLEIEKRKPEAGTEFFEGVSSGQLTLPASIQIKQFFVEDKNLMAQEGFKAETLWFYIMPEGLVQDVLIKLSDSRERKSDGNPFEFTLRVNPFTAHVSLE